MRKYAYTCPTCGPVESEKRNSAIDCPQCGKLSLRDWRTVQPLPTTCHPSKGA